MNSSAGRRYPPVYGNRFLAPGPNSRAAHQPAVKAGESLCRSAITHEPAESTALRPESALRKPASESADRLGCSLNFRTRTLEHTMNLTLDNLQGVYIPCKHGVNMP